MLWGESKPCEFWAVGDLEGMRVAGAGETCRVVLTQSFRPSHQDKDDEEEEGEETVRDGR